ncbi:uncharacterized protein B0H64DRAFT_435457 [Chaetomium fimeti]|uniref:Uncharacterized protein n=1 Tax=Chaetomium fimeti TaxID=1854472 RepID=A0AAE0HA55_9PEZI|nr:hypothetical protein B0H64DRAFT_435457 [Chaetomium fimeti]
MPQDPHLYGQPPPKKQKKEIALSGSLAFSSQLSSFLAEPSTKSSTSSSAAATTGRTRPSKLKKDGLSNTKVKRKDSKPNTETKDDNNKLSLKSPLGTEESKAEREFARRKMESKARVYAAMQRGDYIGREVGLVDFDRKWAESKSKAKTNPDAASSDSDSDSEPDDDQASNIDTTLHEHTDEFGRVRQLTRSQILRLQRGAASATELEHMSARPKAPAALIYGDAVQAEAFAAHDGGEAMEALARKRDRSATPPEATHYQADWEIRTKGVGFYKFSKEEGRREAEMRALEEERAKTEGLRREREEKARRRKQEIEERRKEILERRTKKMADSFLEGLEKDLVGHDDG